FIGQVAVAGIFALLALTWVHTSTMLSLTRLTLPGWDLTSVGWFLLAVFVIVATSNAVNLTDGVDGLAPGTAVPGFLALGLAAQLQGRSELAGTCWSVAAVLLAFLVFNRPRAKIFMGDAGSLALGLMLAVAAAEVGLLVLLPLLGAVFLVETGSVILQVGYFRLTGGRRLFRMSPLHHHLEMGGLGEWAVDLRLWAASWAAGALALLWAVATGLGGRPG
ncbi:MAG: phospho-N-acetylmuramoyl-pentapeptide-transferase, partial [Candidatus Dormibacteria bacterium]